RAHMHIEVMQRTTADAHPLNDIHTPEDPVLNEAAGVPPLGMPEGRGCDLVRRAWEIQPVPALALLQDANRASRLRQAAGGDGAAKAGADDHYVIRRTHPPTPVGASPDRCHWVLLACSCQHLIPYPLQALKPGLGVRHLAASEYPTHFLGQQIRRFQVNKVA